MLLYVTRRVRVDICVDLNFLRAQVHVRLDALLCLFFLAFLSRKLRIFSHFIRVFVRLISEER